MLRVNTPLNQGAPGSSRCSRSAANCDCLDRGTEGICCSYVLYHKAHNNLSYRENKTCHYCRHLLLVEGLVGVSHMPAQHTVSPLDRRTCGTDGRRVAVRSSEVLNAMLSYVACAVICTFCRWWHRAIVSGGRPSPSVANSTVPPKVALARLVMLVHSGATSIEEDCCPSAVGLVAAAVTPPGEEATTELAMIPRDESTRLQARNQEYYL